MQRCYQELSESHIVLFAAIRNESDSEEDDWNADGFVNEEDVDFAITEVAQTAKGDIDLDGRVDFLDFLELVDNFGKEAGWAGGDFDGNGKVDFLDFLQLSENFGSGVV